MTSRNRWQIDEAQHVRHDQLIRLLVKAISQPTPVMSLVSNLGSALASKDSFGPFFVAL